LVEQWNMGKFFEVAYDEGMFTFHRREDEIERYARLDGCYVIRSNVNATRQTTDELRDRYKDLKYVEQVSERWKRQTFKHVRFVTSM